MQRDPHGEDGGRLRVSLGDIQDGAQDPVHELCEADAAVCVGLHQRFRLAVGRKTGAQFNTLKTITKILMESNLKRKLVLTTDLLRFLDFFYVLC